MRPGLRVDRRQARFLVAQWLLAALLFYACVVLFALVLVVAAGR